MSQPNEVIIDGTRYVPAKEAIPSAKEIMKGLMHSWWHNPSDEELEKKSRLRVIVTDTAPKDRGRSFEDVLTDISKYT